MQNYTTKTADLILKQNTARINDSFAKISPLSINNSSALHTNNININQVPPFCRKKLNFSLDNNKVDLFDDMNMPYSPNSCTTSFNTNNQNFDEKIKKAKKSTVIVNKNEIDSCVPTNNKIYKNNDGQKSLKIPSNTKRNARERKRVRTINDYFSQLQKYLPHSKAPIAASINNQKSSSYPQMPIINTTKKLSKVETLKAAIEYIEYLQTFSPVGFHYSQKDIKIENQNDFANKTSNFSNMILTPSSSTSSPSSISSSTSTSPAVSVQQYSPSISVSSNSITKSSFINNCKLDKLVTPETENITNQALICNNKQGNTTSISISVANSSNNTVSSNTICKGSSCNPKSNQLNTFSNFNSEHYLDSSTLTYNNSNNSNLNTIQSTYSNDFETSSQHIVNANQSAYYEKNSFSNSLSYPTITANQSNAISNPVDFNTNYQGNINYGENVSISNLNSIENMNGSNSLSIVPLKEKTFFCNQLEFSQNYDSKMIADQSILQTQQIYYSNNTNKDGLINHHLAFNINSSTSEYNLNDYNSPYNGNTTLNNSCSNELSSRAMSKSNSPIEYSSNNF